MSKLDCNERTILLSPEAQSATDTEKDSSHCKKSVLSVLLVVSGLVIFIFVSLMMKWHIRSQSVISPSQFDSRSLPNEDQDHDQDDDEEAQSRCPPICGYGAYVLSVYMLYHLPLQLIVSTQSKHAFNLILFFCFFLTSRCNFCSIG